MRMGIYYSIERHAMKPIKHLVCTLLLAGAMSLTAWAQENQTYFMHTIEKGQSLYSIASMYGISQGDILRLNVRNAFAVYFIQRHFCMERQAGQDGKETG